MNWQDNKLEMSVVGLAAAAILGVMGLGTKFHFKSRMGIGDINYSMPRPPSTSFSEFSLDGREIRRSSIAAPSKAKNHEAAAGKQEKAAAAKPAEKKTAANTSKKADQAKKPTVSVTVVDKANDSGSFSYASASFHPQKGSQGVKVTNPLQDQQQLTQDLQSQDDTLTEAQWKALIETQPTTENFIKLITAANSGKVGQDFAYNLMLEAFSTHQETTQENIIAALPASGNSAMAFRFAVKAQGSAQGKIGDGLSSYVSTFETKSKFGVLNQVLATNDAESVTKALDLISNSLSKKVSTQTYEGRTTRTGAELTAADFALFKGNLSGLVKSDSSEIKQLASSILSQLGTDASVNSKATSLF